MDILLGAKKVVVVVVDYGDSLFFPHRVGEWRKTWEGRGISTFKIVHIPVFFDLSLSLFWSMDGWGPGSHGGWNHLGNGVGAKAPFDHVFYIFMGSTALFLFYMLAISIYSGTISGEVGIGYLLFYLFYPIWFFPPNFVLRLPFLLFFVSIMFWFVEMGIETYSLPFFSVFVYWTCAFISLYRLLSLIIQYFWDGREDTDRVKTSESEKSF